MNKLGVEGKFLNMMKGIYEKPTATIVLNGEKLNASLLRSEKTRMPISATSIQHCTGHLARGTKQGKKELPRLERKKKAYLYSQMARFKTQKL